MRIGLYVKDPLLSDFNETLIFSTDIKKVKY
jgi:hypothetical protein